MRVSKSIIFLIGFFLILEGCQNKTRENKTIPSIEITNTGEKHLPEIEFANQRWKDFINQKSDSISSMYSQHAVSIDEEGNIQVGNEPIKNAYLDEHIEIKSIQSNAIFTANESKGLVYELGEFTTNAMVKYTYIVIWNINGAEKYRAFEFSAKANPTFTESDEIHNRRKLWIDLCNRHNPEKLINEMYSKNTMYFNHKPLVIGRKALIDEYSYMNKEEYQLTLNPLLVNPVNEQLVYEIGQCKGSYNGKYIIIWRKNENGKWEVFIDSNI